MMFGLDIFSLFLRLPFFGSRWTPGYRAVILGGPYKWTDDEQKQHCTCIRHLLKTRNPIVFVCSKLFRLSPCAKFMHTVVSLHQNIFVAWLPTQIISKPTIFGTISNMHSTFLFSLNHNLLINCTIFSFFSNAVYNNKRLTW